MYSLKEIASWYNVDPRVILRYIHSLGIKRAGKEKGRGKRGLLSPSDVLLLKQHIGEPISR